MNADTIFEHRDPIRKPGWQKALPWIVGVVVIGALLGYFGYHWSNTGHSTATPLLNKPADDRSAVPPTVKLTPGATIVARRFIQTAVARKNLPMRTRSSPRRSGRGKRSPSGRRATSPSSRTRSTTSSTRR